MNYRWDRPVSQQFSNLADGFPSFPPACPVESIETVCYFVLRTSFVTAELLKAW